MRISTRRTLLRTLTAVAIACTAAVVLLPAGASQAGSWALPDNCDLSLATGCVIASDISQPAVR
jgi:hypothetical protein